MSTATLEKPKVQSYEMPPVWIGDLVYWHPGGETHRSYPALVTQVNNRSICLSAFEPNMGGHHVIDGARHKDDPDLREWERLQFGTWSESSHQMYVIALVDRINALAAEVKELKAKK